MELDEKLARWRWPEPGEDIWLSDSKIHINYGIDNRNRVVTDYFTSSLDACFKWLTPKLPYIFIFDLEEGNWGCWMRGCDGAPNASEGYAETPALALCKAIEQLIDKEGDSEGNKS